MSPDESQDQVEYSKLDEAQGPKAKFAKKAGIDLINGRWEPTRFLKRQAELRVQQDGQANATRKTMYIVIGVILAAILMPLLMVVAVGGTPDYLCIITTSMIIFFIILIAAVMFGASTLDQVAIQNVRGLYPVVETRNGRVYLDGVPVDMGNVASCHLDRGHEEFRIVSKDWRRTVILYKQYEWPDTMASALKAAFEVNGIPVEETLFNFNDPDSIRELSHGARVQEQDETAIQQKRRISDAQRTLEEERKRLEEERFFEEERLKDAKASRVEKAQPAQITPLPTRPTPSPPVPPKPSGNACPRCGASVDADLIECPRCGSAL